MFVIYESKKIQTEADRWVSTGRRGALNKKADKIIKARDWPVFHEGMRVVLHVLLKKFSDAKPDIWKAQISGAVLLFFANTEQEVLDRLGKPQPRKDNSLVKMAVKRISDIRKTAPHQVELKQFLPLDSLHKCRSLINQVNPKRYGWAIKSLVEFVNENPNLTDAVIEEAWNLTEVRVIMES
jgi:hypothetical protein